MLKRRTRVASHMGGSSSKPKITSRDRAILELKVQRDRLKQYQKKIRLVADREYEIAKEQIRLGNKDLSLLALRKKKYQEQLLAKTDNQLLNLEQLTANIEFAQVELEVFKGLKKGNEILGEIQKEMSLEEVEMLMQETAEAIDYQNEISRTLAQQFSTAEEEDINSELDNIISEIETAKSPVELPAVPTHEPVVNASVEESEEEGQDERPTINRNEALPV